MFNLLRNLFSRKNAEPNKAEMTSALARLDELLRPAIFGQIGGARPNKDNRISSWWGGNFVGSSHESVPVCKATGRPLHPVLQIRVDELPEIPETFKGLALINLWLDLQSSNFWGAKKGEGFCVRTYVDLDELEPVGPGFNESSELPTFPIFWREVALEQPDWEDIVREFPPSVASMKADKWFYENLNVKKIEDLRRFYRIKVGGWPAWIQGSDWPNDSTYFFQIDSTEKGKLLLGDAGSLYIFKTTDGWDIRGDCY